MSADPKTYARWRAELAGQAPERQNIDTDINGYYRMQGARTKPDFPVAIWQADGEAGTIFQIGRKRPMNNVENETEWWEFIGAGWLDCIAVSREEWAGALDAGRWTDGKPSRQLSDEEKLDLIPDTPAEKGGNMPEEERLLIEQQIDAKVDIEVAKAHALGAINTMEKAQQAAEIVDRARKLWKLGDAKREEEYRPHKDAADAVQAKWSAPLDKAKVLGTKLVNDIEAFKRAEQQRLQREADEAARIERERLEAEAQRVRDENAKRLAEAEESGGEPPVLEAEPEVEIVAPVVAAPKVSSAYGRAITKVKVKKGRITDEAKFIKFLRTQADFKEWLQDKANKLARAKLEAPGVEMYEE